MFLERLLLQLVDTSSKCSCPQQLKYSAGSYCNCICPPTDYFKDTKKQAMSFILVLFSNMLPQRQNVCRSYILLVSIFRWLKVSSNKQNFIIFHRRTVLVDFKISHISVKVKVFFHSLIFLVSFNVSNDNSFFFFVLHVAPFILSLLLCLYEYSTRYSFFCSLSLSAYFGSLSP